MRIATVGAIAVDIPLSKNFGGSTCGVLKRPTVITRLRADEGLVGNVCNGDNRAHGAQIASHLLAAVPHGSYAECFADPARDPVWQLMWINRPPVKNGIMPVASDPGFGIELDEKMVRQYRSN